MDWREGWKALTKDGDRFISYVAGNYSKRAVRTYAVGVETYPAEGCGSLLVFEDLTDALRFLDAAEAFLGENKKTYLAPCRYLPATGAVGSTLAAWYPRLTSDGRLQSSHPKFIEEFPAGTRFADRVILTEEPRPWQEVKEEVEDHVTE